MANASWGKRFLAIAVACCVCALIAVPAYAFYYVHSDEGTQVESKGVYEITCVLDETAQGGSVRSELVIVPEGSTVKDLLNEDVRSSNNQNGLSAIHNYDATSLADYLSGKQYTCTVYAVGSQKPGTQTTHDGQGTTGESTVLNRYDNVVIKVA